MESVESFFDLIRSYNAAIWPAHVVTFVLGVVAVILAVRGVLASGRTISGILAFLWLWSGVVFLMVFLGSWTPVFFGFAVPGFGYVSGILFIIQGALFAYFGVIRPSLSFELGAGAKGMIGALLVIYAMLIYPVVGYATGRPYPGYPVFGTAACPVAIFTVGMLFWTGSRLPRIIPVIPVVWCLAGILAVISVRVWADTGLFAAGIVGFVILRRSTEVPPRGPRPVQ